ncbi:unnamed protein product [Adineta steineri]|uniref:Uncharacterized protein n=1 Tax=Adineta steineri TaxID=433720 RepID=A0A819S0Z6_9BILA|nr:unnamed protein product [Adineta steineri]CAF4052154.1 unnamed protein product [Adineta steineri]
MYKLNNRNSYPQIILIYSQTAWISIESFDNLVLSSTSDQIAKKTDYILYNRSCSIQTKCSFDDTFNRTVAFQYVELTSIDNFNNYRFSLRHSPSYQIIISSSPSFNFELQIDHCDLNDSLFLLSLTKKLPHIVMWGSGRCRTIRDILVLSINR